MTDSTDKLKGDLAYRLMMAAHGPRHAQLAVALIEKLVDEKIADLREELKRVGNV